MYFADRGQLGVQDPISLYFSECFFVCVCAWTNNAKALFGDAYEIRALWIAFLIKYKVYYMPILYVRLLRNTKISSPTIIVCLGVFEQLLAMKMCAHSIPAEKVDQINVMLHTDFVDHWTLQVPFDDASSKSDVCFTSHARIMTERFFLCYIPAKETSENREYALILWCHSQFICYAWKRWICRDNGCDGRNMPDWDSHHQLPGTQWVRPRNFGMRGKCRKLEVCSTS